MEITLRLTERPQLTIKEVQLDGDDITEHQPQVRINSSEIISHGDA
jgi:hypothetical protein